MIHGKATVKRIDFDLNDWEWKRFCGTSRDMEESGVEEGHKMRNGQSGGSNKGRS